MTEPRIRPCPICTARGLDACSGHAPIEPRHRVLVGAALMNAPNRQRFDVIAQLRADSEREGFDLARDSGDSLANAVEIVAGWCADVRARDALRQLVANHRARVADCQLTAEEPK